jgi:hypothetical protein
MGQWSLGAVLLPQAPRGTNCEAEAMNALDELEAVCAEMRAQLAHLPLPSSRTPDGCILLTRDRAREWAARIKAAHGQLEQVVARLKNVKPGMPCRALAEGILEMLQGPPALPDDYEIEDDA